METAKQSMNAKIHQLKLSNMSRDNKNEYKLWDQCDGNKIAVIHIISVLEG